MKYKVKVDNPDIVYNVIQELLTSKDTKKGAKNTQDARVATIVMALGGIENIVTVSACATRLRLALVDGTKVDKDTLKTTGAVGTVLSDNSAQVIYGADAIILAELIKDNYMKK